MADTMTEQRTADTRTRAPERARVNVLAFGSPTTTRYLAFLAALLSAGVFVGSWVYNQTQGQHWVKVVISCAGQAQQAGTSLPPVQAELAREAIESKCRGAADLRRAAYALGGAGVAGAGAVLVVYLAPVVVRRRRRLRGVGTPLQGAGDRFAALADQAGVRSVPRLERGPADQRDAFSYGAPGRPRVVLPPAVAVRWRDQQLFDPLVRHELAHVRHRDVALAWLARSVWYALAPLLALPVVVALLSSDRSILGDFVWRASLLGLTVLLVSSALLRSREHDADLRVAQIAGETGSLTALLQRAPQARPNRLRRLAARHPTPEQRILVLQNPERATGTTFVDGFSSAFLSGLLFPLVANVLVVMFTGWGRTDLGASAAALLAGPLLGGSVGLGVWRAAVAGRVAGVGFRVAPVAAGVAAGLVLGQLVSLAGTGSGSVAGLDHPAWLAVSAVLGCGATALSAGMAQLWADAIPRMHRGTAVTATVVINSLIFASALWIASTLQFVLDSGGLTLGRAWLVTLLPSADLVTGTVAVLALSAGWALWARTGRAAAPAWVIERGDPLAWPSGGPRARQWALAALASGIMAAGSLAAFHFIAGPPTTLASQAQAYYLYIWVAAAAGAACTLTLCRLDRARGAGVACLAAPLATLTATAGFLVMNTALGGQLSAQFVFNVARPPLALGLLFCLTAALAGLIPPASRSPQHPARTRPARLVSAFLLPAACAVAISALLITSRDAIIGPETTLLSSTSGDSFVFTAARLDGLRYLDTTAPAIEAAYSPVQRSIAAAGAASSPRQAAALIRAEALPQLHKVLQRAEAVRPGTAQLAAIHQACLTALRDAITEYSLFAQAFQTGDAHAFARAKLAQKAANAEWATWQVGLLRLKLGAGIPVTP
jgi:Zn-dependent protease with chaperone function